jgi:nitrate reductase gamma subunit
VEAWIEFGRGPLFRMAFSLMLLGLLRILYLALAGIVEAYRASSDKIVPWRAVARQTGAWLVPVGRLWRLKPIYSSVSLVFHVGLIAVPLFFASHVLLWKRSVGFAWPAIPLTAANWLTLAVIGSGLGLFAGRVFHRGTRALSRLQDYFWPLLLTAPFVTGYVCVNAPAGPRFYQATMLVHVYSADAIMLLIPFTKIAHCVLAPLSQAVTAVAWKFPAGAGARVAATLGYRDRPSWLEKARLEPPDAQADQEVCTE